MTEVSCLSQHLCSPREGHLDALYKVFRYLQKNIGKNPGRIAFDSLYIPTDEIVFSATVKDIDDWKDFYPDEVESMPRNMIEPLGSQVFVKAFVDANREGNLLNRRSHSGILIYVNNAPIIWYSKRQNTVESSSFGSEFVTLRIATELIE